jgi:hypothetical protein
VLSELFERRRSFPDAIEQSRELLQWQSARSQQQLKKKNQRWRRRDLHRSKAGEGFQSQLWALVCVTPARGVVIGRGGSIGSIAAAACFGLRSVAAVEDSEGAAAVAFA